MRHQPEPPPAPRSSSPRYVGFAALVALCVGTVTVVLAQGFNSSSAIHSLEEVAIGLLVIAALIGVVVFIALRMAGWRDPESEREFDELVTRSERLARSGRVIVPGEEEFDNLDPLDDDDFDELVRDALDDLPDLLRNALQHVAVIVSDDGRRHGAYGLYQGDGIHRDNYPDRIVIFRDTLRRDFGHDPALLHDQVVRTVRHELAHHVGFDELGVSRLDL